MNDQISALLAETHNHLREQLNAAQRHHDRLQRLLETRESRDIANLNHAARRLRSSAGNWPQALVQASAPFCEHSALFALRNGLLHLEASSRQCSIEDIALETAPAFRSAVESKDTVVAVPVPGEMSPPIAAGFSEAAGGKFHLFPILAAGQVVALLYAGAAGRFQTDALELLATLAGAILESQASKSADGLVNISAPRQAALADSHVTSQHFAAQRFARVQVAEIRLHQDQQVKSGRAGRDLYSSLKTEIDSAREAYRRVFVDGSEDMPDYLHQELVHTLAHGDVEVLGPDYPGPMA
jgi:hypothetical protein